MIETLLNKPFWVIDNLPEQVPEDGAGRYFAVEDYYLQASRLADIHGCFANLLLKLNCYYDFQVSLSGTDEPVSNPLPDLLVSWIQAEQKDLSIILPGEDALITLFHDDTCMTVYHPSETLLKRIGRLAAASSRLRGLCV